MEQRDSGARGWKNVPSLHCSLAPFFCLDMRIMTKYNEFNDLVILFNIYLIFKRGELIL